MKYNNFESDFLLWNILIKKFFLYETSSSLQKQKINWKMQNIYKKETCIPLKTIMVSQMRQMLKKWKLAPISTGLSSYMLHVENTLMYRKYDKNVIRYIVPISNWKKHVQASVFCSLFLSTLADQDGRNHSQTHNKFLRRLVGHDCYHSNYQSDLFNYVPYLFFLEKSYIVDCIFLLYNISVIFF